MSEAYVIDEGIFRPVSGVTHREEEYDSTGFNVLRDMQERHFWYKGRHRFLNKAFQRTLKQQSLNPAELKIIDLGGGCGGWVKYLTDRKARAAELALGDSSLCALDYASDILPGHVTRYQIDLLQLGWEQRWDVAFLLDVLEHIPDHAEALKQIRASLTPGGLLFITTPALQRFWTYNDALAHHVRRYSRADYQHLARVCGYELLDARYFMFYLSPLLLMTRWSQKRRVEQMSPAEQRELQSRMHRVPGTAVNTALSAVFAAETPLGHFLRFPWGTSILAVLKVPG